jgi:hypothetical protein
MAIRDARQPYEVDASPARDCVSPREGMRALPHGEATTPMREAHPRGGETRLPSTEARSSTWVGAPNPRVSDQEFGNSLNQELG